MSNARIVWTQKVAGREPGEIETVEIDTDFMRGCLANKRFEILSVDPTPAASIAAEESPATIPSPAAVAAEPAPISDLLGLTAPKPKPAAKPRARAPKPPVSLEK